MVYESIASATVDDSDTLVITKPTGLAVGDIMIAGIVNDRDSGSGTMTVSTPSGWTLEENVQMNSDFAAMSCFSKVADSSDVAASNFTFTGATVTGQFMMGHIVRFSAPGTKRGEASGTSTASGTTTAITGFTPTAAATHVGFVYRGFASAVSVTSLAYATDDPAFTERAEAAENGTTIDGQLAVYTATRSETTATGNITATFGASDNTRTAIIVVAYSTQQNGSVTPTTYTNAYALTPVQSAKLNAAVDAPTTNSFTPTIWTTTNKS